VRREHFDALRPFCPTCKKRDGSEPPLRLESILKEEEGHILQGLIVCSSATCQREYPVLDGIPFLIPNLREYVAKHIVPIQQRWDVDPVLNSVLGDCCGPGSPMDVTRQHLSNYGADHYGDLDPVTPSESAVLRVLQKGLANMGEAPAGPTLDVGCSVGRTTFELAGEREGLVLGVDLSFSMLRVAAHALRTGRARYPRRRVGIVYDERDFEVDFQSAAQVDFWLCDAEWLPFHPGTFATINSLNVLDCLPTPHAHFQMIDHLLHPEGQALLGSPYDWSTGATAVEAWIGGHSQRGAHNGASEPLVRSLVGTTEGQEGYTRLEIAWEEEEVPWGVRLHDRSRVEYQVHLMCLRHRKTNK